MKTVINKETGVFLFHVADDNYDPLDSESVVDFTPEPENPEKMLQQKNSEFDKSQYFELKPTDWYFIRKADTGEDVPKDIVDERSAIRKKYAELKSQLQTIT